MDKLSTSYPQAQPLEHMYELHGTVDHNVMTVKHHTTTMYVLPTNIVWNGLDSLAIVAYPWGYG